MPVIKKTAAKTRATKSTTAPAAAKTNLNPAPDPAPATKGKSVTAEQRYKMIQEAAYFIAQRKAFKSDPLKDWVEAEAEIKRKLGI